MDTVNWKWLAAVAALVLGSAGCVEVGLPAEGNQTHAPLWPIFGMHGDPAFEDQQTQDALPNTHPEGMRYPPPKTVPRTHRSASTQAGAKGAEPLENPVRITESTLEYGRVSYKKTCAACHGTYGLGDGPVADTFANYDIQVPPLANERVQRFSDARIYRTIAHGVGNMWSYKSQLKPMERWAVVNYVRALQRAKIPEPWDRRPEARGTN